MYDCQALVFNFKWRLSPAVNLWQTASICKKLFASSFIFSCIQDLLRETEAVSLMLIRSHVWAQPSSKLVILDLQAIACIYFLTASKLWIIKSAYWGARLSFASSTPVEVLFCSMLHQRNLDNFHYCIPTGIKCFIIPNIYHANIVHDFRLTFWRRHQNC